MTIIWKKNIFSLQWTEPREKNIKIRYDLEKLGQFTRWKIWFEFLEISSGKWCSIFQNSGKDDNLAMYIEIFGNFTLRVFVSFDLLPGISGIFVWIVCIPEIPQFSIFRNLTRKFPFHLHLFLNLWTFFVLICHSKDGSSIYFVCESLIHPSYIRCVEAARCYDLQGLSMSFPEPLS